jgi:hypothetical protein
MKLQVTNLAPSFLTSKDVIKCAASTMNVSAEDITKPDGEPQARKREVVFARQLVITYMRTYAHKSFASAGGAVGRDHATALHATKTMLGFYETSRTLRETIDMFLEKCIRLNAKKMEELQDNIAIWDCFSVNATISWQDKKGNTHSVVFGDQEIQQTDTVYGLISKKMYSQSVCVNEE